MHLNIENEQKRNKQTDKKQDERNERNWKINNNDNYSLIVRIKWIRERDRERERYNFKWE